MTGRLAAARALLRKHRCTHLLVSDPVDVEYLCGFHSSRVRALICPENSLLVTDFRYQEAAIAFCEKNPAWNFILIEEDESSCIASCLPPRSTVGFQSDVVTVDELARLTKECSGAVFVPVAGDVSDLFVRKTPAEISLMKRAAAIGDRALARLWPLLSPGITEQASAGLLEALCRELGSEKPSFDTIVLFGKRSALPHGVPGSARLKKGDFILVDFGCVVDGFCSDMTRTVVFGTASLRQREIYGVVQEAQAAACAAARSGRTGASLDSVGRAVIAKAGYGSRFGHSLGHGVGRRIHENPRVAKKNGARLPEGSVVTIEPGIYLPGFGGVRIEDMVVLGPTGAKRLTRSPRDLLEL
ncbi:MAG: aminopeptidase P family protein [Chitinispirillaceae bacterium]|jgi:Xaa-Pro aminopeptidase|nr:aminopeptidase P family protein [Chitinispirillaceae bacterium]